MAHIYDIGTRAWQPDTTEGWVASEVTDKQIAGDKVTLVFKLENGEVRPRPPSCPRKADADHVLRRPSRS
jgi:myosin heavy subunit